MGTENNKEKKRKGASLIYVLIILSMISVFSASFLYFVKEKAEIVVLKDKNKSSVSINYLINKEKKNSELIMSKGVINNGIPVFLQNRVQYFNSGIETEPSGNVKITRTIFLPEKTESIGNFVIEKITDDDGNEYSLPLNLNTVYKELEIFYKRKVLGKEIRFAEKIFFKRINPTLVEIFSKEDRFIRR